MRKLFIKFLLLVCSLTGNISLYAEVEADFRDENMYYNIKSMENRECYLLGLANDNISKLVVPEKAQYNGATFTVVGVWTGYSSDGMRFINPFRNVEEIILPKSVKWIGIRTFDECPNLRSVQMSGVERIGSAAFRGCYNLKNITLGRELKVIGQVAFGNCHRLAEVKIPPSCKEIEERTFVGCKNPQLTITIEDSSNPLRCSGAFQDCSGGRIYIGRTLEGGRWYNPYFFRIIEYGDRVTEMPPMLIDSNDSQLIKIKQITIGASIKQVPDFSYDNLEILSIYLVNAEPPSLQKGEYGNEGGFSNRTYLNGVLYVPKGSISAYKGAPIWKKFLNIQEYESERIIAASDYVRQKEQEQQAKLEAERRAERERQAKFEAERRAERERQAKLEAEKRAERERRAKLEEELKEKLARQKKLFNDSIRNGFVQGHECVDLGLSVAWSTCNIGASTPKKEGKKVSANDIENSMTDWRGKWRLPTQSECWELQRNCKFEPIGWPAPLYVKITSKINGNSMILPYYVQLWTSDKDFRGVRKTFYWNDNSKVRNTDGSSYEKYDVVIRCVISKE